MKKIQIKAVWKIVGMWLILGGILYTIMPFIPSFGNYNESITYGDIITSILFPLWFIPWLLHSLMFYIVASDLGLGRTIVGLAITIIGVYILVRKH